MDLDLSTHQLGERAVVSVGGEIDLETASQLGDHALDAVREVSPHVVLDLTGVTFMDSTGLKVLLTIQRRADLAGGSFAVVGASRLRAQDPQPHRPGPDVHPPRDGGRLRRPPSAAAPDPA